MQSAQEKITALLEQTIGLKASAIGATTLDRAIRSRMRVMASRDLDSYLKSLATSRLELRLLVEEVVVPETWFFRDQEPFAFLARYITQSGKDLTRESFRILSLPCSTGEEPYSIAMALLQAGVAPPSFYIDAVDVSERVLERARKGLYRDNSFRTGDLSFRDVFFTKTEDGFVLQKTVRDKVRFLQGNIIQPGFMRSLGRYDVVFCRNVLIYFNEEAQHQSMEALHQALQAGGILFTGHAEAGIFYTTKLFSVMHARAFVFRRQEPLPAENWRVGEGHGTIAQPPLSPLRPSVHLTGEAAPRRAGIVRPPQAKGELALVRQLADEGRLEEAARRSEEHLRRYGPAAEWYYILGIIRDSQGQSEEALKLLRKAVYIDPENVESLVYLALLAERAGDLDGAANYKRRVKKLREGGKDLCQEKA
ncbi:MAG: CheR family methyltransferase [Desulfobulbaceae bacterium]